MAVPRTIGWLKPVVLLPAVAITGLLTAQIETLLAHELAHVWRHDYLVNLLQSAVETLLFCHPAVWWASRLVRTEREPCCDDTVISVCDRLVYMTALSDLAAIGTTPRVGMAASNGSLLRRVSRILGGTSGADHAGTGWLPAIVLMLLAGAFVSAALTSAPFGCLSSATFRFGISRPCWSGKPSCELKERRLADDVGVTVSLRCFR